MSENNFDFELAKNAYLADAQWDLDEAAGKNPKQQNDIMHKWDEMNKQMAKQNKPPKKKGFFRRLFSKKESK